MGLAEDLLSEGVILCRDAFGNFVMQHMLEYGSDEQRTELIQGMKKHVVALGSDVHAGAPLAKALLCASDTDRAALAQALLAEKRLVARLACMRHGHLAVQAILELCDAVERNEAISQLRENSDSLHQSRYGRAILHDLTALVSEAAVIGGA
jgi:pumilio RNA-binding family